MTWKATDPQMNETAKTRWRAVPYTRGKGLDLGCGPEKLLATKECIGIDSCKDVTLFNIPMNPDVQCDVTDLKLFASGAFDYAYSSHVLEHIPLVQVPSALREWMRVIRIGGHLVIYVPDEDEYPKCAEPERGIFASEPWCNPDHKWNVNYERIVAMMEKTGYNWDLVHFEKCNLDQEYSLFFAFEVEVAAKMKTCRSCLGPVDQVIDLGLQPASNALLERRDQLELQIWPLVVGQCQECGLLQTLADIDPTVLFTADYPYFSGQSAHWVKHCSDYADMIVKRLGLDKETSIVVEVGGNDGTLLKFLKGRVARAVNFEPCHNVAMASREAGVETDEEFFSAGQMQADLIIANNVLAHTPDLNGFANAVFHRLKRDGTFTAEFPWALNLVLQGQFDTIYHEHYSYLTLGALTHLFARHQLAIYDVEEIPTHGGSLRIYVHRTDVACPRVTERAAAALREEKLITPTALNDLSLLAKSSKAAFWKFMRGKTSIVGYGAAAKGNTFLNYVGATKLPFVADTTPAKIGKFLPGSLIPIVDEKTLLAYDPEWILVLAWNWKTEIIVRLRDLGYKGKFLTCIPRLEVWE